MRYVLLVGRAQHSFLVGKTEAGCRCLVIDDQPNDYDDSRSRDLSFMGI